MGDSNRDTHRGALGGRKCSTYFHRSTVGLALAATVLAAMPAAAQSAMGSITELGLDAAATFGLGSQSSVQINLPGSRFRVGFLRPGSRFEIEPAAGFSYNKVEGTDGVFEYDLQLGALYHFTPIAMSPGGGASRVTLPYVRPFVGVTGFSGGSGASDHEFSAGGGLGVKVPWRTDLSWRLEANLGYGFTAKAARLGLAAGLSYFPR